MVFDVTIRPKAGAWTPFETFHPFAPIGWQDARDSVCRSCSSPAEVSWNRWLGHMDWRSALETSRVGGVERDLTRRTFLCVALESRDSR